MPILTTLISRFVAWRARRQTEHMLQQLTDRELADIGIGRADIPLVARHVVMPAPRRTEAVTFPRSLRHAWPA